MFDIAATELLVIIIVAVLVIGPKDMPAAMRVAGRWIGKVRKVSSHFRTGLDAMVREAELEDMEKKWKAQNEDIMRRSAASAEADAGAPVMTGPPPVSSPSAADTSAPSAAAPLPTKPVQPEATEASHATRDAASGTASDPKAKVPPAANNSGT